MSEKSVSVSDGVSSEKSFNGGVVSEISNASRMPDVYYCKHMVSGLAGYDEETILVDLPAIKKMSKTFIGKPVYTEHKRVNLEKIQQEADGYVTDCWYCEKTGWLWSKFIAISDESRAAIDRGWSVSNAYDPKEWADGGTYTNISYTREILDGNFTHLALVPNPRYESAVILDAESYKSLMSDLDNQIELKNSKGKRKPMLKFFKNEKKELTSLDDLEGAMIELQNGKTVSVQEMVNAVEDMKKKEKDMDEKTNMDSMIRVGEEEMPLKELVNKYMNMCEERDNAKDDMDMDENKEKKNEDEGEKEEDEKMEKKNSTSKDSSDKKHFEELRNAGVGSFEKTLPYSKIDGLSVGKSKY